MYFRAHNYWYWFTATKYNFQFRSLLIIIHERNEILHIFFTISCKPLARFEYKQFNVICNSLVDAL